MSHFASAKISAVLCTYNGAAFIKDQLLSILNQSLPVHEIVVLDDGSTDDTLTIINGLALQHPQIRVLQNSSNLGYNKNFEKALSMATGDVLAISDQDDVWHPQKLERLLQQWKKDHLLIYSNAALFSGPDVSTARPDRMMHRFEGTDPRRIAVYNTVSGHAMLIKKELLQLALPFNPDVYYDWWLALVAACNGGVQFCPEVLVYQRWHGGNATDKKHLAPAERQQSEKEMVRRNLEQFKKAPGLSGTNKQFFENLHRLWEDAMKGRSQWELFLFLMRHSSVIYASKRRKIAFFSHLKRSFRYAYR